MSGNLLSIIVIAHKIPNQLPNTLYSLSAAYQNGSKQQDYEVLVIENASDKVLDREFIKSLPDNFHYFLRQENSQSPVSVTDYALEKSKGQFIGLMTDGAHMLTPGVIALVKDAWAITDKAFVTVPAYQLGPAKQHLSSVQDYDEDEECRLLSESGWKEDGYQLFSIASWFGANPAGFFAPIMESNCHFASREAFNDIVGADSDFRKSGGGTLNLDIIRKLGLLPHTVHFTLAGEGSFHQFHGCESRSDKELQPCWDKKYRDFERNPIMLGSVKPQALGNLIYSAEKMLRRSDE